MLVRKAKPEDLYQILNFQLAMARETEGIELDYQTLEKGVLAVLEDSGKGIYYMAEKEGTVIGSLLTTFEWSDWRNGTVLWIQSVYVVPEFRRKGVYSKLYGHIKTLVQEIQELKGIRLYADIKNEGAHTVYRKLGMTHYHYLTFEWLK
jgi:GNAT superfamily N-acetyltransferase